MDWRDWCIQNTMSTPTINLDAAITIPGWMTPEELAWLAARRHQGARDRRDRQLARPLHARARRQHARRHLRHRLLGRHRLRLPRPMERQRIARQVQAPQLALGRIHLQRRGLRRHEDHPHAHVLCRSLRGVHAARAKVRHGVHRRLARLRPRPRRHSHVPRVARARVASCVATTTTNPPAPTSPPPYTQYSHRCR